MPPVSLLRQDLNIHQAESDDDGSPAWVLHDPMADNYFRLNWIQVQMMGFIEVGDPAKIADKISKHTCIPVSTEDVQEFLEFLGRHHLLRPQGDKSIQELIKQVQEKKSGQLKKALRQYLFIRIPLWRPEKFLSYALPWFNWAFHPFIHLLVVLSGIIGFFLVLRQVDLFVNTALDFLTLEGLLIYALVISFVKVLHELGHAFAAYRNGCRVRRIGIIILVFFPVLYTDVSDAWKLYNRRDRLAIGSAGMLVELAIACVALFFWGVLPEGSLKDMAFVLATASWITTLMVNLNPLLRFDGYYLLADYWGIPNLQTRAMALVRWQISRFFLGLPDPPPENPQRRVLIYGWMVGAYRLFLMVVISLLIYHMFFKTLALILIGLLVSRSLVEPLIKGVQFMWKRYKDLRINTALIRTFIILAFIITALIVPWKGNIRATAVLQPVKQNTVYAPFDGQLLQVQVEARDRVTQGQILAVMHSPDLDFEKFSMNKKIKILEWQLGVRGFDPTLLDQLIVLETDFRTSIQRRLVLESRLERSVIRAPLNGKISSLTPGLREGTWIGNGDEMFSLIGDKSWYVLAYVDESDLGRITNQSSALFYPNRGGQAPIELKVEAIETAGLREFDSLYPTAPFGGPIPVHRTEENTLVPVKSVYRVYLKPEAGFSAPMRVLAGNVSIEAQKQSLAERFWRNSMGVLRREAGF